MSIVDEVVFKDKNQVPDDVIVEKSLKNKFAFFKNIIDENNFDETVWKFYSKNSGWTLQCKIKNRNIMYMQIITTGFYVWFTFGKAAKEEALKSSINSKIKDEIKSSKIYREGTTFKVFVEDNEDIKDIKELISIKINN